MRPMGSYCWRVGLAIAGHRPFRVLDEEFVFGRMVQELLNNSSQTNSTESVQTSAILRLTFPALSMLGSVEVRIEGASDED